MQWEKRKEKEKTKYMVISTSKIQWITNKSMLIIYYNCAAPKSPDPGQLLVIIKVIKYQNEMVQNLIMNCLAL